MAESNIVTKSNCYLFQKERLKTFKIQNSKICFVETGSILVELVEKCQRENANCIWKVGARVSKCTRQMPMHSVQK